MIVSGVLLDLFGCCFFWCLECSGLCVFGVGFGFVVVGASGWTTLVFSVTVRFVAHLCSSLLLFGFG